MLAAVAVLAAACTSGTTDAGAPPARPGVEAGRFTDYFDPARLDLFFAHRAHWYSENLRAMGEPTLLYGPPTTAETYRFLWLRTFHHPVSVRIERRGDDVQLHAVELDGQAGYEPGQIMRCVDKTLSIEEWSALSDQLDRLQFWTQAAEDPDRGGKDGARWILEGRRNDKHHVTDRWSPDDGPYRDTGLLFLKLSGLPIPEDDLY